MTVEADGFSVTSGNAIAWAISTAGPITSMAELQAAIDAGLVFSGDDDSTLTLTLADLMQTDRITLHRLPQRLL